MILGTFQYRERIFPGVIEEEEVYDLSETAGQYPKSSADLRDFLAGEDALAKLKKGKASLLGSGIVYKLSKVRVMAPLLRPGKIICIGWNYSKHADEAGSELPEEPVFFNKFATSIIGPQAPIVLPAISKQVDYEAELAVVIGKRGKRIPEEAAMEYVAGYTAFNDISARDLQFRDQWVKGKALDTFAPLGPFLVTQEEVPDPHNLRIRLLLNGEVMQDASTGMMIFKIPTLISFLSQFFTLEPGDIIATGTPEGVGFTRDPQVLLKPGDRVTVSIERVGELSNPVVGESY
ncbi:MAG TPA: fumarylacetoacetate hydrolase family protein [Firmicutes bacterium]|nr:fumarylacetoacetate hydrolase family protein [Bacillota bacterium]